MRIEKKRRERIKRGKFVITLIAVIAVSSLITIFIRIISENEKNIFQTPIVYSNNYVNSSKEYEPTQEEISVIPSPSAPPISDSVNDAPNVSSSDEKINVSKLEPIDKNYKNFFRNDLFIGDSITDGMSAYDFIEEANVCAKLGLSLVSVKGQVDKAKIDSPKDIFILLGMNDLCESTLTSEKYVIEYTELINYLKNKYPNANIYVQSILPVASNATDRYPYLNNERINEFNSKLKSMTSQEKIRYLNINSIINSSTDQLFEQDGEHFKSQFYPIWLNYIENIISE